MGLKTALRPTKLKVTALVIYLVIVVSSLFYLPGYITDSPSSIGYPFVFKVDGCFGWGGGCVHEFYPGILLLDVLIHIMVAAALYLSLGLLLAIIQRKQKRL